MSDDDHGPSRPFRATREQRLHNPTLAALDRHGATEEQVIAALEEDVQRLKTRLLDALTNSAPPIIVVQSENLPPHLRPNDETP